MVNVSIAVGTAYGVDIELVRSLLLNIAEKDERVVAKPEATVLLTDFGDDGLKFELLVWAELRSGFARRRLASDLRFAIDGIFSANNITLPTPQRELTISSTEAIPVQVKYPESS